MLLLIIICAHLVGAQSNGDIQLIQGSQIDMIDHFGRLEIYLDGEWGTFCIKGFDSNARDAACRQLGYANVVEVSKASDTLDIPLESKFILCSVSVIDLTAILPLVCIFSVAYMSIFVLIPPVSIIMTS